MEHVSDQLVALPLGEQGGTLHRAKLVEPHQLAIVELVCIEPLELHSHRLELLGDLAGSLLVNRPVTVSQDLDRRQLYALYRIIGILREVNVHLFRQLDVLEHLRHFVYRIDPQLHF